MMKIINETTSSITVEIKKKVLTITAEDQLNITVGSQMPEFTYKVEGLVEGDKLVEPPIITAQTENTNRVGEYEIMISGSDLTNRESYQIVYVNGKMTIIDNREDATIIEDTAKEEGKKETEVIKHTEVPNTSSVQVNVKLVPSNTEPEEQPLQEETQEVATTKDNPVSTKYLDRVDDKVTQNNQKALAPVLEAWVLLVLLLSGFLERDDSENETSQVLINLLQSFYRIPLCYGGLK